MKRKELLQILLDFGETMLLSGAEVNRVEDTLSRIGKAYGAEQMNVFTITSSIIITAIFPDGGEATQTRRIRENADPDYDKLESLNALSRYCCSHKMTLEELRFELNRYREKNRFTGWSYLGGMIAAGSFCVFFGGNGLDAIASILIAGFIVFMQDFFTKYCPNRVIFDYLCAFFSGLGICLIVYLFPILHVDKIMIGDIMLLIPGVAITTSVKDVLVGDTISGMMRFMESLLWAGALACGFISAIYLCGGVR